MAARTNTLLSALATAVKLNPRLSAGLAFELGVMVGAFVKSARGRKGLAGATAKLIDAVPSISMPTPARRTASRKAVARKPARKRRQQTRRQAGQ
jgi:hypothetical protein